MPLPDQPAMFDRSGSRVLSCRRISIRAVKSRRPIRHLSLYSSPFRIRHRSPMAAEPDYGDILTPETALSPTGPLHEQGPGDLTRWMGLPWQADTGFCRARLHQTVRRIRSSVLARPGAESGANGAELRDRHGCVEAD